jgi:hypothetical protein
MPRKVTAQQASQKQYPQGVREFGFRKGVAQNLPLLVKQKLTTKSPGD